MPTLCSVGYFALHVPSKARKPVRSGSLKGKCYLFLVLKLILNLMLITGLYRNFMTIFTMSVYDNINVSVQLGHAQL
jgi:hypothetical protein